MNFKHSGNLSKEQQRKGDRVLEIMAQMEEERNDPGKETSVHQEESAASVFRNYRSRRDLEYLDDEKKRSLVDYCIEQLYSKKQKYMARAILGDIGTSQDTLRSLTNLIGDYSTPDTIRNDAKQILKEYKLTSLWAKFMVDMLSSNRREDAKEMLKHKPGSNVIEQLIKGLDKKDISNDCFEILSSFEPSKRLVHKLLEMTVNGSHRKEFALKLLNQYEYSEQYRSLLIHHRANARYKDVIVEILKTYES